MGSELRNVLLTDRLMGTTLMSLSGPKHWRWFTGLLLVGASRRRGGLLPRVTWQPTSC